MSTVACRYHKKVLLKGYDRILNASAKVLYKEYGQHQALTMIKEASAEYEQIIYKVPYIGSSKDLLTKNLISSAQMLSLIIMLNKRGIIDGEIRKVIWEIENEYVGSLDPFLIKISRIFMFSRLRLSILRKGAAKSNNNKYSGGWIYDFVSGKKEKFIYGIDYRKCGIFEFYKNMGYRQFVKHLCSLDYLIFSKLGVRLERTKTIGSGEGICDFRFYSDDVRNCPEVGS
jgi:hypothetical protein